MSFRVNTNISAMSVHNNMNANTLNTNKSLGSLSSGLRINKASDDASGMSIADSLRQQSQGLSQAIRNANDGIGLAQTADGALDEYVNIIDIIRTKAIQAASDGQNKQTREAIQSDINKLLEEAQNIASSTKFNGQSLLNGSFQNKSFHIGAYAGQSVNLSINSTAINEIAKEEVTGASTFKYSIPAFLPHTPPGSDLRNIQVEMDDNTIIVSADIHSTIINSQQIANDVAVTFNGAAFTAGKSITATAVLISGSNYGIDLVSSENFKITFSQYSDVGAIFDDPASTVPASGTPKDALSDIDVTTRVRADEAIDTTDRALVEIDAIRSDIGSVQNQLEATIRNISVTQVNVQAAESQIRDVDFAAESSQFAKLNIISQSGSYAMSQANSIQQNVLRLLQ